MTRESFGKVVCRGSINLACCAYSPSYLKVCWSCYTIEVGEKSLRQLKTRKMLPGLMSLDFWHSDGRVRIGHKRNENTDPSCLVTTVQAGGGGVMVWGIFSWHSLGPLVPIEHCLNATACLSIVSDHVHLVMSTMYPFSDGYLEQDNACHKAWIISNWFLEHDNKFTESHSQQISTQ